MPDAPHRGWSWRALAALPALAFAAVIAAPPINHDVGAVLSFAERWAGGAELYRDILDVNPPLVFVLFRAPVWLGAQTGLGAIAALQALLLALCLLSFLAATRLAAPLAAGPAEAALRAEGVPAARSRGIFDLVADPHLTERGIYRRLDNGAWSIALPWRDTDGWRGALGAVPALGGDNGYVFGELLDLDPPRRRALEEAGAIR